MTYMTDINIRLKFYQKDQDQDSVSWIHIFGQLLLKRYSHRSRHSNFRLGQLILTIVSLIKPNFFPIVPLGTLNVTWDFGFQLPVKSQKIFCVGGFCYGLVGSQETTQIFVLPTRGAGRDSKFKSDTS